MAVFLHDDLVVAFHLPVHSYSSVPAGRFERQRRILYEKRTYFLSLASFFVAAAAHQCEQRSGGMRKIIL